MGREGRFEIKNLFAVPQRYLGFPTDPAILRPSDDTPTIQASPTRPWGAGHKSALFSRCLRVWCCATVSRV